MAGLSEFRAQYPDYNDMSDAALADALYQKYYSDLPRAEFDQKIGLKPEPQKGALDYLDDAVRSVASGATFGFADELAAKANELIGRGTYGENLKQEQARDAQISPAIKIPGEVAGAVAGTVAAAPVAAATGITRAAAALPKVAQYVGGGALGGAAFGAGNAEPGHRLEGATTGALVGGAMGAAVPPIVGAVGRVAGDLQSAGTPITTAAADLRRAIARDADTPESVIQRVQDLKQIRPGMATIADAGGENVRGLVERIAQTPGAGRTLVVPALTERQQGQLNRVSFDLSRLTGENKSAHQAVSETMQQRSQAAKPLYEKALSYDIASDEPSMAAFLKEIRTGWGRATINSPALRRTLQTEYGINGNPGPQVMMPVIDAWKKSVDDLIRENPGSNKSRVLQQMLNRVIPLVDAANPVYAQARNAWAGPSRYLDAIEDGRKIFGNTTSAEELTGRIASMTDAEREGYRIGAISAIKAKMGNDAANMADMTKYLRSPEMRTKIAAIMPTPEAQAAWQKRLDFEVESSKLTGRALGNSATARRLAEREDAEGIVGDLVLDAFSGAPPVNLFHRILTTVPRRVRDTLRSRSDEVLAHLLTEPQTMESLRKAIQKVEAKPPPPSPLHNAAAIQGANALLLGR